MKTLLAPRAQDQRAQGTQIENPANSEKSRLMHRKRKIESEGVGSAEQRKYKRNRQIPRI